MTDWPTPDWSLPIEAVNVETGEVRAVELTDSYPSDWQYSRIVTGIRDPYFCLFQEDGGGRPWRIRNIAPQPETVPVDKVVWERVVAFFPAYRDDLYTFPNGNGIDEEARSIHALLSPVDPDLLEARELFSKTGEMESDCRRSNFIVRGAGDDFWEMRVALNAIKRGRELAQKEAK